jgi:pilus assembly protein CpaC
MELRDGQSFAIAGLIDNQVIEQFDKIPGIGSIPVLGKLFTSKSLNKSKDELLIVVTPHIVQPLNPENVPAGPVFPLPFLEPVTPEQPKAPNSK